MKKTKITVKFYNILNKDAKRFHGGKIKVLYTNNEELK